MSAPAPFPLLLFPIAPAGTSYKIGIKRSSDSATEDETITFTAGEWVWPSGDANVSAGERDLVQIVFAALNGNGLGINFLAASFDTTTHLFTVTTDTACQLQWSLAGADRFDPAWLGFTTVDTVSGTTHAAPNQPDGLWAPKRPFVLDTREQPAHVGAIDFSLAGVARGYSLELLYDRTIGWGRLPRPKILTEYAAGTEPRSTLQRAYEIGAPKRVRIYDDETTHQDGSGAYQRLVFADLAMPWTLRNQEAGVRYDATLKFRRYIP